LGYEWWALAAEPLTFAEEQQRQSVLNTSRTCHANATALSCRRLRQGPDKAPLPRSLRAQLERDCASPEALQAAALRHGDEALAAHDACHE